MKRHVLLSMVALSLITAGSLNALAEPPVGATKDKGDETKSAARASVQKESRPHMDLAFCIDTTGSMQGEIDQVKSKVKSLVAKLASGKPAPIVRVGMVAYRDRGDAYVVKNYQFTEDIDKFVKDVSDLRADGGGDGPEAVDQGLRAAVHDLNWAKGTDTAKLLFLIGDAPPHAQSGEATCADEARKAISSGIQINTIACAGLEQYPASEGTDMWKKIAKLADGKFDTLTYHTEVVNEKGEKETVISSGGATYRVKPSASRDWKAGVGALMARGEVDKLSEGAMSMAGAKSAVLARGMAMPAVSRGAYKGAELSRAAHPGAALGGMAGAGADASFSAAASYGGGGAASVGRGDSNLDDIMVSAARERAKKVLKVDYGR